MKNSLLYIFLLAAILLGAASCTGDDAPGGSGDDAAVYTLSGTIGSRAFASTQVNELINSWWMAFVNPAGDIVAEVLDRQSASSPEGQPLTGAVERESFSFSLPKGTYKVYAFANFTASSPSSNIWGVKKGKKMPDLSAQTWATPISDGSNVPMTGFTTITVPSTESQNLMVEVVRMYAKLQFDFASAASSPNTKTVRGIRMLEAAPDKTALLPDYALLGGASPELPADTKVNPLEFKGLNLSLDNPQSYWAYVFESTAANHPTGHYVLEFDIETNSSSTETITALAYELDHITRNDYVLIPVKFTDWTLELDVRFYPPIGGYPAVVIDSKGREFYAKFGSSGFFEIETLVSDSATGEKLTADKYDVAVTVDSGSEIFSQVPAVVNRQIVGELAEGKTGTAELTLTMTVKDDKLQHTFTRKLFIIRN